MEFRVNLAALAAALLLAPAASAQDGGPLLCPSSPTNPIFAKTIDVRSNWHTTVIGHAADSRLWQVGRLGSPVAVDHQAVMQFPLPLAKLRGRKVLFADLTLRPNRVTGWDVGFDVNIFGGDGLGNVKDMLTVILVDELKRNRNVQSGYFYEGERESSLIWADEIGPALDNAVSRSAPEFSLTLSPAPLPVTPAHLATIRSATLRVYHCPL